MGAFPTGVAIVTAVDNAGRPHGMTCTSLASVSLRPPTLLICLNSGCGTLAALMDSGAFAVNVLHAGARPAAELFASPRPDRFGCVTWQPSALTAAPWLTADAVAIADCRVCEVSVLSDHHVVFGQVIGARHGDDGPPLLHGRRRYGEWAEEQVRLG